MKQPIPFDESKDPDRFWEGLYTDPFDGFVPPGWVSDLVYYFRGTEIPTIYAIWAGLAAVSSVIKREAWLRWYPGKLFANLFIILIGPAGGKKSTIVDFVIRSLKSYHIDIENPTWREVKRLNVLKNKASPEGILEMMLPDGEVMVQGDDDKTFKTIEKGSEMFIGLTEMSVMLNKQQYNTSTIQNLLDLYDTHGSWEWTTKSEKKRTLKNIYTTILAATTPSGFKDAVPSEAIGDGFLSRTIIANSGFSEREFVVPLPAVNGPTEEILTSRLAYIAQAVQGTYVLSDDAFDYLSHWYSSFKCELKKAGEDAGIMSRQNIHLLKVALLIHAQSYPKPHEKEISLDTVKMAQRLISATYLASYTAINQVKHKGEFADVFRVKDYIMERECVERKKLQASTRINVKRLDAILKYLNEQGDISIWDCEGDRLSKLSRKSNEVYRYEGPTILRGDYGDFEIEQAKREARKAKDRDEGQSGEDEESLSGT